MSLEERYLAKVDRSGGPEACWPWTSVIKDRRYGVFWAGERFPSGNKKLVYAHRFGHELLVGPIPAGLEVCHSCDNPPCQNPAHWFLGTHGENMADMLRKGRARASGEANPMCRHSDAFLAELRDSYTGVRGDQARIARQYGLSTGYVSAVLRGIKRAQPAEVTPSWDENQ